MEIIGNCWIADENTQFFNIVNKQSDLDGLSSHIIDDPSSVPMFGITRNTESKYFNVPDFIIPGSDICTLSTYMVIIIQSTPDNIEQRSAIRNTWGEVARSRKWLERPLETEIKVCYKVDATRSI